MKGSLGLSGVMSLGLTVILLLLASGCSSSNDDTGRVLVFAATSLTDVLGEVEKTFEAREQIDVTVSYGASQTLAQQIVSGAPADMFFSAGSFPMRFLEDRDLVETPVSEIVTNKLVVVVGPSHEFSFESLRDLDTLRVTRISIADPNLAPAGRYALESLTRLGLWEKIKSKLVLGSNVRTAMAYLESGNADVVFVYATDAMANPHLRVLDVVPPRSHSQITYPLAIIKRSVNSQAATVFLDFVKGDEATEIFRKHGFVPEE